MHNLLPTFLVELLEFPIQRCRIVHLLTYIMLCINLYTNWDFSLVLIALTKLMLLWFFIVSCISKCWISALKFIKAFESAFELSSLYCYLGRYTLLFFQGWWPLKPQIYIKLIFQSLHLSSLNFWADCQ